MCVFQRCGLRLGMAFPDGLELLPEKPAVNLIIVCCFKTLVYSRLTARLFSTTHLGSRVILNPALVCCQFMFLDIEQLSSIFLVLTLLLLAPASQSRTPLPPASLTLDHPEPSHLHLLTFVHRPLCCFTTPACPWCMEWKLGELVINTVLIFHGAI